MAQLVASVDTGGTPMMVPEQPAVVAEDSVTNGVEHPDHGAPVPPMVTTTRLLINGVPVTATDDDLAEHLMRIREERIVNLTEHREKLLRGYETMCIYIERAFRNMPLSARDLIERDLAAEPSIQALGGVPGVPFRRRESRSEEEKKK